ncbi:MAG TPA: ribonucleotide-diphosphate reductase subunit beta [Actinomycetota bacterium]|nr:ribonucleotide-diphosphate reductase subunit beta [Actinomycetota bacterium]
MTDVNRVVPDVVHRVEDASLREMRNVDIDDVYRQMDWLLESRPTPLDLYDRWEKQNWSTQDLDFSEDAVHWRSMEGGFEGIRTELQRSFTLFFVGEQAVTDTLAPLVHGAPDEPSRIFLSTQLVDEARHSVFFSRFFDEVIGISGGLSEALSVLRDRTVGGFRKLFDEDLVDATEAVRKNPHDYGAWVQAITVYHLIVEGMLALTGQKYLLGILREMQILPGFYAGFTAVARDESRHVNFGVRAILEAGLRDRTLLERVETTIMDLLPQACRIVAAPDRRYAIEPHETPENLLISPYEIRSFSLTSLTKRLRVAGLSDGFCDSVTNKGMSFYDEAWAEYEDIHGVDHPRRFFDQMAASTG